MSEGGKCRSGKCRTNNLHEKCNTNVGYKWKKRTYKKDCCRPVERGRRKVFAGPATFWGPRRHSKILKMVFQMASFWPKICVKSIFSRGSAPDPAGGAYNAPPEPLVRWWGDTSAHVSFILTPLASRSRRVRNEVAIGPGENGFQSRTPLWLTAGLDKSVFDA